MKGKYLISADSYFFAPDGQQYKAVWGEAQIVDDTILGIKTNRNSTNWYVRIGSDENHVIIAGCQIHYAVKSPIKPMKEPEYQQELHEGKVVQYSSPTRIYITE